MSSKLVLMTETQRLLGMIDVDPSDLFDDVETHCDNEVTDESFTEDSLIAAIDNKHSRRHQQGDGPEYNPTRKKYSTLLPRQIQERNRFRKKQFQLVLDGIKWQLARPTTVQVSHERSAPYKDGTTRSDHGHESRSRDRSKLRKIPSRATIKRLEVIEG